MENIEVFALFALSVQEMRGSTRENCPSGKTGFYPDRDGVFPNFAVLNPESPECEIFFLSGIVREQVNYLVQLIVPKLTLAAIAALW